MNKNTMSGNEKCAYKAESKWKNGIEKKALIALCSFSLLSLSAFPSFAENANNNVESGTNNTVSGDANAWNLEDNSISFFEVPELVNHYSSIAEMEKDLISQSTKGMEGVKSAVKEQKADIVDALSDNISLLKDQRDNTEDKTVKEALGKEIAKLEKVKNSKKILPGLDSSLVEANYALTELAKTDKEMTKAEKKTEKSIRSQFLTGKALLSDAMQNLLFSYAQTENTRKMLEKRVSLMQRSLDKIRKEQSLGKATGNDVAAAELSLKSAEADLNKLRDGMDTMKRNIGLSLGWHMNTYQNITIESIPDFPREYLNGRNQEKFFEKKRRISPVGPRKNKRKEKSRKKSAVV